jgi:hypothetical protein
MLMRMKVYISSVVIMIANITNLMMPHGTRGRTRRRKTRKRHPRIMNIIMIIYHASYVQRMFVTLRLPDLPYP